ncbi:MAG: CDP-alcohol phosphatidyltransferase family protein, partial [Eubacteriales bacterium]
MKKRMWLPNALTIFRMVGSLLLLGLHGNVFWMIYILCGLSDMLDGFFARKFCAVSRMGSILDSLADFLFVIACCVRFFPCLPLNMEIKVWIAGIAAVKLLTVVLLSVRSGRLTVLHT